MQRALDLTRAAGIRFGALLILGLPGETEESLEYACRWAEEHQNIVRVKYLSAMPGTTVYRDGLQSGLIHGEAEHLRWLSIEQGLVTDEFLNYNDVPDEVTRRTFQRIHACYCEGPVMRYQHTPANIVTFYPDPSVAH